MSENDQLIVLPKRIAHHPESDYEILLSRLNLGRGESLTLFDITPTSKELLVNSYAKFLELMAELGVVSIETINGDDHYRLTKRAVFK